MRFVDWRQLDAGIKALVESPAMRSRERVMLAAVLLSARGVDVTQEAISDASGLPRSTTFRQLASLVKMGAMTHRGAHYQITGEGEPTHRGGCLKQGETPAAVESSPGIRDQNRDQIRDSAPVPESGTKTGTKAGTGDGESSPGFRDSDIYIRDIIYNPPLPPPSGLLAGSGSDLASVDPEPGWIEPGWYDADAVASVEPEWPAEWMDGLLDLIREMTPPGRGQRFARPLNMQDRRTVEGHVRSVGGWRRFEQSIMPRLREAQGVQSPLGWLGWACRETTGGVVPEPEHRWVPAAYQGKAMGFRSLVAALTAVAWGSKPEAEVRRGAMAWALENINRREVREALLNGHGPSPWVTDEVRDALVERSGR